MAARDDRGYGNFALRKGETRKAHRVAYAIANGVALGKTENGCHSCNNPPCCNPKHIFAGTQKQNMEHAVATGIIRKGEARPESKLTENEVRLIRLIGEHVPDARIAAALGVARTTVLSVRNGKTWRHVS